MITIFSTTELNVWARQVQYKPNQSEPKMYKNTDVKETYLCLNHEVKNDAKLSNTVSRTFLN